MKPKVPFEAFTWSSGRWESALALDGRRVRVLVTSDERGDEEAIEERASTAVVWTAKQAMDLLLFCAAKLLDDYNSGWSEGPDDTLTTAGFVRRLSLVEVDLAEDGSMRWLYHDGGMFQGHDIVVTSDQDLKLCDAYLEG